MIEVTYLMASTEALIRSLTSIISRNLNVALVLTNVFLGIVALSVPYFTKYLERHVFHAKIEYFCLSLNAVLPLNLLENHICERKPSI